MTLDLAAYLPNLERSATHDLTTANGERFLFKRASSLWAHQYDCYTDWWQYIDYAGQGEYLYYFFGDYDCPGGHDLWGEAPAIRTIPRHWDEASPFDGTVQYVGTRLRREGAKWVAVQTVEFTARTTVRRIVPGAEGEPTVRVTMQERSAQSEATYLYELSDGLSVDFGASRDKGIKRFQVLADGTVTKDLSFVSWISRG